MRRVRTAFAWALLLPAVVWAAPERPFAELLPEGTVGYFEANALTDAERKVAVAYRCLREPEMRRALDRLMAEEGNFSRAAIPIGRGTVRIQADLRESGAAFNVEYAHPKGTERVRFRGNLVAAWVGLGTDGPFGIDAVAALQVEGDSAPAYRLARRLLGALRRRMDPRKRGFSRRGTDEGLNEYRHGDVLCTVADFGTVKLHVAAVGSRLVLATTRARLVDVIDRSKKPAAGSLSGSERFRSIREHANGDGTIVMLMHVDLDRAVKQLAANYPRMAILPAQLKSVGLGGLRAITSTSRADGAGIAGTTSVLLEGRRFGLARLFEKDEPAKFGTLAFAPRETLYVASGRFNPPAITRMLAEMAPLLVSEISQALYQETGIVLYEDLVKVIGPEAAFIVSSNQGLIPDVGIVCESSDAAKLERTVLKALSKVNWRRGTGVFPTRLAGGKAYVIKMLHPGLSEVPIAPTFGVVDGHFVAALFPISFQRFANTKRGHRPNITKNPDYVTLRKRVPKGALSLSYLDLRRSVGTVYDTMIPFLQAMPQQDGVSPVYEMPDASIFMRHLYGRVAWRIADERGLHWHSHSSVDLTPLALGFVGGVAGALAYTRESESAAGHVHPPQQAHGGQVTILDGPVDETKVHEQRRCTRNVRELMQVLRFHRKRNRKFPESLEDAAREWVTPRTLDVPGHKGKHYRYFGPQGKGGILLAGLPNGQDGRICVITTDLKMSRITPHQLHEHLDHPESRK